MAVVPEIVFHTLISRGIRTLQTDPRYIDQLFVSLSQDSQEQLRTFIQGNQIDLSINFPRSPLSLPALVILLKSDNESPQGAYLGDYKGSGLPDEFSYDGDIAGEVLGGTGNPSGMSGPGGIEFGPHRVLSATTNTLSVTDGTFYNSQFMDGVGLMTVRIVAGTGAGQHRGIVANSSSNLMVDENWLTIPDSTSVFEVRAQTEEIVGQPSKLYDRRDKTTVLERKGALYVTKYQIQVACSNQEQTIYLYTILKAIFTLSRIFMERNGIINLRMSGTDFAHRPDYLPDNAYIRMLSVEFESPFDVYESIDDLVDNFTLCLTEGNSVADSKTSTASVDLSPPDSVITGP